MEISNFFEAAMVISFGLSWPMSIVKSVRSKTAKGKSLFFLCMIFFGYVCGIFSKVSSNHITYVLLFYIMNIVMVGADIVIYFINRKHDEERERN